MSRRENWRRQLQLRLRWFCSASFSTELLLFVVSPLSCWLPGDLRLLQLLFKAVAVESETRRVISSDLRVARLESGADPTRLAALPRSVGFVA